LRGGVGWANSSPHFVKVEGEEEEGVVAISIILSGVAEET